MSQHTISELIVPQQKRTTITDTVASLRLDSVIASAFGLSRGKAAEAIGRGIVFVNHVEVTKPDFQVSEGDKLTPARKGKSLPVRSRRQIQKRQTVHYHRKIKNPASDFTPAQGLSYNYIFFFFFVSLNFTGGRFDHFFIGYDNSQHLLVNWKLLIDRIDIFFLTIASISAGSSVPYASFI